MNKSVEVFKDFLAWCFPFRMWYCVVTMMFCFGMMLLERGCYARSTWSGTGKITDMKEGGKYLEMYVISTDGTKQFWMFADNQVTYEFIRNRDLIVTCTIYDSGHVDCSPLKGATK